MISRLNVTAWLMALIFLATGCAGDEIKPSEASGTVDLVMNVVLSNSSKAGTRAQYPDGYDYDFEVPSNQWETVASLRVIIVSKHDGTVEHNSLHTYDAGSPPSDNVYGEYRFPVKSDDGKFIYLIANEDSYTPAVDFSQYTVGKVMEYADMAAIESYREWPSSLDSDAGGASEIAFINNEGVADAAKKYVPMSEIFEITVKGDEENVTEQHETFFITRSLVKFAFFAKIDDDTILQGSTDTSLGVIENYEGFRIKSITFNDIMQKQFLFPKNTEYLPAKYPSDGENRVITAFETPPFEGNRMSGILFEPKNFGVGKSGLNKLDGSWMPEYYFCETRNFNPGNKYSVDVVIEFSDGSTESFENVELPNLPSFPRNTVVKVYLTFVDRQLKCTVTLVPYGEVVLKPNFGIEVPVTPFPGI